MYRIADIGHVWVMTDIFEKDREFVKPGAMATVRYRGREFPARMSDVLPQFDPQSRTLKTRFELDNPGYILRPDMFVDVEIHVKMPAAITVPADAVIDSGRRKTVYVDHGGGYVRAAAGGNRLAARRPRADHQGAGARRAHRGRRQLPDRLREPHEARGRPSAPPVAARRRPKRTRSAAWRWIRRRPDAIQIQHGGKTYYFCSEKCKNDFEANPESTRRKQRRLRTTAGCGGRNDLPHHRFLRAQPLHRPHPGIRGRASTAGGR